MMLVIFLSPKDGKLNKAFLNIFKNLWRQQLFLYITFVLLIPCRLTFKLIFTLKLFKMNIKLRTVTVCQNAIIA